jgi:hypothetical protein
LVGGDDGYAVSDVDDAVQVLYWKFGPDLASAGDAPLMPDRFRYAIVDYAVAYGCMDRGDVQGAQSRARRQVIRGWRGWRSRSVILEPSVTFIPAVGDDC